VNVLHQPLKTKPGPQHMVLTCVSWSSFEKIVDALSEHHLRITYDQGTLELMSPMSIHELWKAQFSHLFAVLVRVLRISIKNYASPTMRKVDVAKGIEPDTCFYLASGSRLRDRREIDLDRDDPPPDLAIEIENTTSVLDRMGIYASMGVPEVWTFDGATLQAHRLVAGPKYEAVATSPQLPFVPLDEVPPLINQAANAADDWEAQQIFEAWVRQRVGPLYQAAGGSLR
jgi:Uma2 family endonuclease